MAWTRREFNKYVLAGVPTLGGVGLGSLLSAVEPQRSQANISEINGVQFGLQPYCYHDLPMNPQNLPILIQRMVQNKLSVVELWANNVEPKFDEPGLSPQEVREKLRQWRLTAPPVYYENIRKQFDAANISIFAYWVTIDDSNTEPEIDAIYRAAKILGAKGVTGSYGLKIAEKIAPFPAKHGLFAGLHNHDNLSDPDALSNEESFVKGLSISPNFKATLDIRHFTAGNGDCMSFLEKHHERTSSIHVGDRRRNNGHSTPFGMGDAPIIEVLRAIRDNQWPILVLLEFEHGTLRNGVEEVEIAYDYCKRALL